MHASATARVIVDPGSVLGPVKPVNGVGQPPMVGALDDWELMPLLKEAGVPVFPSPRRGRLDGTGALC